MGEENKTPGEEFRFSLKAMLREIEAEAEVAAKRQGPIDQSEILKMVQNRKKRAGDE